MLKYDLKYELIHKDPVVLEPSVTCSLIQKVWCFQLSLFWRSPAKKQTSFSASAGIIQDAGFTSEKLRLTKLKKPNSAGYGTSLFWQFALVIYIFFFFHICPYVPMCCCVSNGVILIAAKHRTKFMLAFFMPTADNTGDLRLPKSACVFPVTKRV